MTNASATTEVESRP